MGFILVTIQAGSRQWTFRLDEGTLPYQSATLFIEQLNPLFPSRLITEGYDIRLLSTETVEGRSVAGIRISKLVDEGRVNIRLLDQDGKELQVQRELLDRIILVPSAAELADQVIVSESESLKPLPVADAPMEQEKTRLEAEYQRDQNAIKIRVWEKAVTKAREHAKKHRSEVGGICVGRVTYAKRSKQWIVEVTDTFAAEHTVNQGASVTFTVDTWSAANRVIDRDYANSGEHMVGWYHTHPGFGVFISSYDRFVHENFFTQRWHIALVIDPCRGDEGFFAWNGRSDTVERYPTDRVEHLPGSYPRKSTERQASPAEKSGEATIEDLGASGSVMGKGEER